MAVGLLLIPAGIFLKAAPTGTLYLGSFMLIAGAFAPRLSQLQVGAEGVKIVLTRAGMTGPRRAAAAAAREAEFKSFCEVEGERLRRFAALLTGNSNRAAALAKQALAKTYLHWARLSARDRYDSTLAAIVELAAGGRLLRLFRPRKASSQPWLGSAAILDSLDPLVRAEVLLRYQQDLDEKGIAAILKRAPDKVRADLTAARATLEEQLPQRPVRRGPR